MSDNSEAPALPRSAPHDIAARLATIDRCIAHSEQTGAKLTNVLSSRQIRFLREQLSAAEGARHLLEAENAELKALARVQPTATLPSDVHAQSATGDESPAETFDEFLSRMSDGDCSDPNPDYSCDDVYPDHPSRWCPVCLAGNAIYWKHKGLLILHQRVDDTRAERDNERHARLTVEEALSAIRERIVVERARAEELIQARDALTQQLTEARHAIKSVHGHLDAIGVRRYLREGELTLVGRVVEAISMEIQEAKGIQAELVAADQRLRETREHVEQLKNELARVGTGATTSGTGSTAKITDGDK